MAERLYGRQIDLNVDGVLIRSKYIENEAAPVLKVAFKVERSRSKEPNSCDLEIYNLNKDNRTRFQKKEIPVVLEAGYVDNIFQIFSGNLTFGQNRLDGRDWVTSMQAGDGSTKFRTARINTSIKGPVPVGDVLKTVAASLGVDPGNIDEKASKGSIRGKLTQFVNGIVLSGKSEQEIDKIIKSMGYSWSIQDGALQLLEPNETIGDSVVLLAAGTGLVGTPEAGEDGFVKVRSLIQRDLFPGRKFKLESRNGELNGFYRIEKAIFVGDTWGGDWYIDIEGKQL